MTSRSRSCKNHPDPFFYICGEFKIIDENKLIQSLFKKPIIPILVYHLVIKANHGLHM